MTKFVRLGTFIIAMSLATVAYGQSDDWHVSGSLVFTNDDPDRNIDDALGGAEFAVGWDFSDHLTLEGALGYSKIDGFYRQGATFVRDSETHLDLGANLLAFFERDRPFAPYVSIGVGYLGVNYNIGGEENRPSASLGVGFKWKPLASRWSLRGEYSSRLAYESDNNLVDGIFALGAEYDFDGPNLFDRSGTSDTSSTRTPGAYGPWHLSGSIVYFDDDPDRNLDDGISGMQINAGYDWTNHLTVEGHLGYSDIDGYYRSSGVWLRNNFIHLDLGVNLLAFYDRNRPFAPYLTAGIGYLGTSLTNESSTGDENRLSLTGGAGFKWRIGDSRFSVRNEYRARLAYEDNNNFIDFLATLGVEYDFGGTKLFDGTTGTSRTLTPGLYGPWYVSGSAIYFDDDPDRNLDDGISGLQINGGYDWTDHLTVEAHLGYANIDGFYRRSGVFVRDSETQIDLGVNLLAFYDRNRQFAPYLMAGIGYLNSSVDNGGDENRPSATAGAGFKWRIGQSRFSIRNEYRARLAYEEDNNFIDFLATLGLEYRFGGPRQRDDLPRDTDGDGVLDMWDECPDTPAGVAVTSRGCEIKRMDRDEDNDRVFDDRDQCPGTPEGMPVDPFGCSLDSDRDGVTTDRDRCPGSRPGAIVDEYGCENDSDGDKVPDHLDYCPNTRFGANVDARGCEIREVITLPGVNFQSNSDLLLAGAERLIQDIAETIKANDYLQIEVAGHTDDRGSDRDNQGLSDRRAKTVYDFLIRYGVNQNRMTYRGYGESQPIADNTTPDGRATNRRVELRVIKE